MGLVDLARKTVDSRTKLTADQLKRARPVRNPAVTWSEAGDGGLVLEAPLAQQGKGVAAWLAVKMKMPTTKKFELEPIGAFLWNLFDGMHTVDTISRKLREEFKMNRMEAEASLTAFLQMLTHKKLITMMIGKAK